MLCNDQECELRTDTLLCRACLRASICSVCDCPILKAVLPKLNDFGASEGQYKGSTRMRQIPPIITQGKHNYSTHLRLKNSIGFFLTIQQPRIRSMIRDLRFAATGSINR